MNHLLLNDIVREQIHEFIEHPSHALLLLGPSGSGKSTLAGAIAANLISSGTVQELARHPFFLRVLPENGTISISVIRRVQEHVRLKTTGDSSVRRLIIIEDAQAMTVEAQNAFLKLLEEPPDDTVILLTATSRNILLPTIYSRAQQIMVRPAKKAEILNFYAGKAEPKLLERYYYLSNGQVGLLSALLSQDDKHPLSAALDQAKDLLRVSTFQRLIKVDMLAKDKPGIELILDAAQRVARAAIARATESDRVNEIRRWQRTLIAINDCRSALMRNGSPKLALTDLMINL